jgi:hypothetical protein
MKRAGLRSSRSFIAGALLLSLLNSISVQSAHADNVVEASCVIGSSSLCPAQSPQEIYNLYGTTTNGSYWINVNGTATQTYLILDTSYPDSGGWFLGMKGTKSSTNFNYSSDKWTTQNTLNPSSLSDDVSTDAKFDAFNYLPVIKLVGVFKDRNSYAFNSSGSGVLGTNSFSGHTWKEDISSQTMFSRFTNTGILYSATGTMTRYDLYRETNASNGKLVFAYQFGYAKYGFNYSNGAAVYRWGIAFNNENDDARIDSSDAQAGIGLTGYAAASVHTYTDSLSYAINGSTGLLNGAIATYPSGFQIWGKMAAPSLAAPATLTRTNVGNGSIRLNIGAVGTATEYAVQYKTTAQQWSAATTVRLTSPNASTPSATITGLTNGTYDFRVWSRATNNSSNTAVTLLSQTIDATAPTISSINITSSAGSDSIYGLGETVTATINWSETVTVAGSPRIPIQGLSSKFLTYASGSGTTSTTFTYVVANDDVDRDGISITSSTLSLNSGTIKDSANNDADLTHGGIAATLALQVDGVPPTVIGAIVSPNGQRITLNFSETISSTISSYSAITLMVGSTRDVLSNGTAADSRLSMSLAFSALSGSTVTLSYADPTSGNDANALQDEAGNDLATFSNFSVTNSSTITTNTTASIALNPASTTAVFRGTTSVKVTTSTEGKVTISHNGKIVAGCRNLVTTSSSPYYATCTWKPSVQHYVILKAQFVPSGAGFTNSTSENLSIYVTKRTGLR